MEKQTTIAKEVSTQGLGLHTANKAHITFKPATAGTGIIFVRTDISDKPKIKASLENLIPSSSLRRTSVGSDGFEVQTVEHLMACLFGLGIDNICIEIDNNEVPGLDGSANGFLELLNSAGIKEQDKERRYYAVKEPVFIEEEGVYLMALPSSGLKISYTLSYDHPVLKTGFLELNLNPEVFKEQLSGARTFCLEEEAVQLRQQGLGKGANYENTLVVGADGVIKNKLRYPDEFTRHKILDLLGDLYLLGLPLKAHIIALRSGHAQNLKLLKKIYEQKQRYSMGGVGVQSGVCGRGELGREEIMKILPHRDPFLFLDKVVYLEPSKRVVAIKNVTQEDYFFKGHFPGRPVMPGVLIVEAMAQAGGIMMLSPEEHRGKLAFFLAANNIKFRKTVVPGDELVLEVEAGRIKSKTGQVHSRALVGGKVVAEADLMFALVDA